MSLLYGDVHRTFTELEGEYSHQQSHVTLPEDFIFTYYTYAVFTPQGPLNSILKEVLSVFVCYRPDVGYIQGMSYIAGLACIYATTPAAVPASSSPPIPLSYTPFHLFTSILLSHHFFDFFTFNMVAIERHYQAFRSMMIENLSSPLILSLREHHVTEDMYLFMWLQTGFLKVLPFRIASR